MSRSGHRDHGAVHDAPGAGRGAREDEASGGDTAPVPVSRDPRLAAVWAAIPDPVRPERPGEGPARVARVVEGYRRELVRRERFGALAPVPLRWAAALAPAVGLVLGLAVTSRLALGDTTVEAAAALVDTLESEVWTEAALSPPLLAELYLEDLGLGLDLRTEWAEGLEAEAPSEELPR